MVLFYFFLIKFIFWHKFDSFISLNYLEMLFKLPGYKQLKRNERKFEKIEVKLKITSNFLFYSTNWANLINLIPLKKILIEKIAVKF